MKRKYSDFEKEMHLDDHEELNILINAILKYNKLMTTYTSIKSAYDDYIDLEKDMLRNMMYEITAIVKETILKLRIMYNKYISAYKMIDVELHEKIMIFSNIIANKNYEIETIVQLIKSINHNFRINLRKHTLK